MSAPGELPYTAHRALLLAAAALVAPVALVLWATPATAAPDSEEQVASPAQLALTHLVAQREDALRALDRQADARDRAIAGQQVLLGRYGYEGHPDDATRVLPLATYRTSAEFGATGPLWESVHEGQDFGADAGTTLVAVAEGVVTDVSYAGPYGLRTVLELPDGTQVWYCHQLAAMVSVGDVLELAQPLGLVGSTGNSTGPHLHLEVRLAGQEPVDPMAWFAEAGLVP